MFYSKYFILSVFNMIIMFIEHRYIYSSCNEIDYLVDGTGGKISKQIEDEREEGMWLVSDYQLLRKRREGEKDEKRYALSLSRYHFCCRVTYKRIVNMAY